MFDMAERDGRQPEYAAQETTAPDVIRDKARDVALDLLARIETASEAVDAEKLAKAFEIVARAAGTSLAAKGQVNGIPRTAIQNNYYGQADGPGEEFPDD